jgi:hypothetical protein
VIWGKARTHVDRVARMVTPEDLKKRLRTNAKDTLRVSSRFERLRTIAFRECLSQQNEEENCRSIVGKKGSAAAAAMSRLGHACGVNRGLKKIRGLLAKKSGEILNLGRMAI